MDDESDDDSCVELVEVESVDHESSDGSADNELNEDDGVRQRFLPLEGSRSKVWKHFGFLARDGKYCEPNKKKCKVVYCVICHT